MKKTFNAYKAYRTHHHLQVLYPTVTKMKILKKIVNFPLLIKFKTKEYKNNKERESPRRLFSSVT